MSILAAPDDLRQSRGRINLQSQRNDAFDRNCKNGRRNRVNDSNDYQALTTPAINRQSLSRCSISRKYYELVRRWQYFMPGY